MKNYRKNLKHKLVQEKLLDIDSKLKSTICPTVFENIKNDIKICKRIVKELKNEKR